MIILKEDWTSLSDGEGRVVVPDGGAGVGGPEAGVAPTRRAVLVWIHGCRWDHVERAGGRAEGIGEQTPLD